MKKIALIMCALFCLSVFTACGENNIVFTTQKFKESNIFNEYLNISSKYNDFISNFEQAYANSIETTEGSVFTSSTMSYKIMQDLILLTMPIFEIGQPVSNQVVYYQNINFNYFSSQSPICFKYFVNSGNQAGTKYTYRAECENAVWIGNNNENEIIENLTIDYTLEVDFNDNTSLKEYTITTSCEQAYEFSNTYVISFDEKTSYIFVEVKNSVDEMSNMQIEYYSLSDDYQISRVVNYQYTDFAPTYNLIDFMFKDYNGRVKFSYEGTTRPAQIKGLKNVTYSDFAKIVESDKQNNTRAKYSYEILQGRISVDKFGSLI